MCGIAGIFNLSGKPVAYQEIKKMADAVSHRGPDGEGFYVKDNVAFGHRRLAILDLSPNGAQPMMSKNQEWVIVFNGCVYNFHELKIELQSKGYQFTSSCDTEVIVEGLCAEGPRFFERLDGMFAIGAWHVPTSTLWVSRDRYGIKPLYYYYNGSSFVFASEIKAILQHPDYRIDVDPHALNEYFTFQNLFTYRTLFKGIEMLPQANTIRIDTATQEIKHMSWWDYDFNKPDERMTFEEACHETERLFTKAVSKQMVADVPVGAYLSGGIDSGSIATLASSHVSRLYTFTCGFDMSNVTGVEANYDERRDAELVANLIKSEHYEQVINAGDLSWSLPKLVWHLEDLRVGMSYPNFYMARLASKFAKVCLQGTGGDELFGGYPWRYYKIFKSTNQEDFFENYFNFWQRLVLEEDKSRFFQEDVLKKVDSQEPRNIFKRVFTFNEQLQYDTPEQHINNSLYFEIKTFLPGLFLVGDKLSMAHGLEERFPFMDNEFVDFAQKVPIRYKLGNLEKNIKIDENVLGGKYRKYAEFDDGKNVLRQAMRSLMPKQIVERKKQGFSAPDESWYRGENAKYVQDLLLGKNKALHEFINPDYINTIIHEHIEKKMNHRLLIWSLMNFEWWCRIFLKNEQVV